MNSRVIKVKGLGKASMPPDQIKINVNLKSSDISYEKTMKIAKHNLENLKKALENEGFKDGDIKTMNFRVDTKYENETTTFNNFKRKFIGYEVDHSIKIEFENDPVKLSEVLNSISNSKSNPEFSILYNLKDDASFKKQMLKNAIKDSKQKALIIAEASEVELGEILSINYSWDEMEIYRSPLSLQRNMGIMSEEISIVPENLEATDTVDIVWKIK